MDCLRDTEKRLKNTQVDFLACRFAKDFSVDSVGENLHNAAKPKREVL